MKIEDIKNEFIFNNYIKYINSKNTAYDINDFSTLMNMLYGVTPFYLNGELISFTNEIKLSENDISDMLIEIYKNMPDTIKEQYMNEILNNSKSVPYKATEYFEKIIHEKDEIKEQNIITNNVVENTDEKKEVENNNDYDISESYKTVEPENKETNENILFVDGPEITKYKKETLAIEKEIEKLEKETTKINIAHNTPEITKDKIKKEIASLVYPSIDPNMVTDEFMNTYDPYATTSNLSDADKERFFELKELYFDKNNSIKITSELDKIKKEIASLVYPSIDLNMVTDEFMNTYDPYATTSNLSNADKEHFYELKEKYFSERANERNTTKDNSDLINTKKQELEKRKANISLYYDCLKDIEKLYNDVKNGLDTDSKEFFDRVHNIDKNKITLPEPLRNELTQYLMKINKKEKRVIPIEKIEKNPKLTWKTFAFLAGGLGLGATIGFTVGTAGLIIANIGLITAKYFVNKKRNEAKEKRLNGENTIVSVEEPNNKLKATIQKFKNYIKSEEGLRDISWGLTGGLIGLNLGHMAKNFVNTQNMATETVTQNSPTVDNNPYSDIRIGDNVGNHNVTVGHDSANWAVNNTNAENLIGKYVNGDSVFQRFAIMKPDGSVSQIINSNGMSINDLIANGIDPSTIAVDVGKNGVSQAWINVAELTKNVANVGRSLH